MTSPFWRTDVQMERLRSFCPKSHGKPRVDDRRILSGIIFINCNGLRWCDAGREYGPAKTLHGRWKRWRRVANAIGPSAATGTASSPGSWPALLPKTPRTRGS